MTPTDTAEVEEWELAIARLAWARTAGCLELASQREALDWHVARCGEALSAIDRGSPDQEDP